jgi:UDP-N-acetylglucosamine transferase subunit ALG13
LPFDRLISAVDDWAGATGRGDEVFAQIGHTSHVPRHIAWVTMIEGSEFRRLFERADLIVSHAGMGTILAALETERPLVVVPRRADLGEHRNDHQLATVARLAKRGIINAANDERDVISYLDGRAEVHVAQRIDEVASTSLIDCIRRTIRGA